MGKIIEYSEEEADKAVKFVRHVKKHLEDYKERGIQLEHYNVMCKICLKTIDEIWEEPDYEIEV